MKTVVVVRDRIHQSGAVGDALERCFRAKGWRVKATRERIIAEPDLIAGWGFREVMHEAWDRWPEKVLHVDAGFWGRGTYMKLALGGRWSPVCGFDYGPRRLAEVGVFTAPSREPGGRVLVCGMSPKAAESWGMKPESWERDAAHRLMAAGAVVTYRPKRAREARWIVGAAFEDPDQIRLDRSFSKVDAVATHHSNTAIEALAAGLPVFVEVGLAKVLSVPTLEDVIGAQARNQGTRKRFLREVAWHQWTQLELADGSWMAPPAPLSQQPLLKL